MSKGNAGTESCGKSKEGSVGIALQDRIETSKCQITREILQSSLMLD